jgi:hypothetical protein
MTNESNQRVRVPMVYTFKKEDNELVVVRFEAYVEDFKALSFAERHFKQQLDQRYNIPENVSRIGIQTLSGEPIHETGIS